MVQSDEVMEFCEGDQVVPNLEEKKRQLKCKKRGGIAKEKRLLDHSHMWQEL